MSELSSFVSDVIGIDVPTPVVVKRGRGRPQVYFGAGRQYIIGLISILGLTKTQKLLNASGAVRNGYAKKFGVDIEVLKSHYPHKLSISMLKLQQLGVEGGVVLQRGRPKTKVVVTPAPTVADTVANAVAEVADAPLTA